MLTHKFAVICGFLRVKSHGRENLCWTNHAGFPHASGVNKLEAASSDAGLFNILRSGDETAFRICATALTAGRSKPGDELYGR